MSTALVVLSNTPQMATCSYCPKPGACCRGFLLNQHTVFFVGDDWKDKANIWLGLQGLDFFEVMGLARENGECKIPLFGCTKLDENGRCSIYADRPQLCRDYTPKQDALCCMFEPSAGEPKHIEAIVKVKA